MGTPGGRRLPGTRVGPIGREAAEGFACPLCSSEQVRAEWVREGRSFRRCGDCDLLFVPPEERPDAAEERRRYESHRNDPRDAAYRDFLARLAEPLLRRLPPGARGLDYGSGPGPTLSRILTEAGHPTRDYDPFFAPDPGLLAAWYDFVTCSEAAEHFHDPDREFRRIDALIRPGGWFGLMTGLVGPEVDLASWWYLRDPTHVCFYSMTTLRWIARRHGWTPHPVSDTVVLFQKSPDGRAKKGR